MVVLRILRSPSAVFRLAAPPGLEFIVRLSILMPVYNEERRAPEAVKQALAVDYPCDIELIVVDDGSKDRTPEMLGTVDDPRMRLVRHERNLGEGSGGSDRSGPRQG
jgi:dolichol-phosphate hexosyltransferase